MTFGEFITFMDLAGEGEFYEVDGDRMEVSVFVTWRDGSISLLDTMALV